LIAAPLSEIALSGDGAKLPRTIKGG